MTELLQWPPLSQPSSVLRWQDGAVDPEPTDQVHFYLEPLVTSASVNMPRMPPLPRDALPLPRDAVPLTVSASKVVGSVSPLVDLSRGGYSWPQATSANCQESWCREGWGDTYNAAHNISRDPFADSANWHSYTAMPGSIPAHTPNEQAVQARMVPLQVGSSKYVAVSGGVNDADAASAEWIKIDDAFNASEVTNGTLTRYTEAYNATVKQYNDTEVDLSWPDWQQQWFEQETEEEEEGMER